MAELDNVMTLIWFNPEGNVYQKGTHEEYRSMNNNQLKIVYEFTNTSEKIIDRMVDSLNQTSSTYHKE
ncbi:MAG: hypothetical protein ACFHWX_11130 [Bacteroidota bacterium]